MENEVTWLDTLEKSDIPTIIIWGELDAVAPVAVPDDVWAKYLENRDIPATYWRIPCADHYLQVDEPELIGTILGATLAKDLLPSEIEGAACTGKYLLIIWELSIVGELDLKTFIPDQPSLIRWEVQRVFLAAQIAASQKKLFHSDGTRFGMGLRRCSHGDSNHSFGLEMVRSWF